MARTVGVTPTSGAPYPVEIGSRLHLNDALPPHMEPGNCAVITDSNVAPLHLDPVVSELSDAGWEVVSTVEFPAGEGSKNLAVYSDILGEIAGSSLPRDGTIFALGGGVVGDLGGFVAASYMRGVELIMLPTTLLAMVDSSVGGKVGVDLPEGKNLVGAFYQPQVVVADLARLTTLGNREVSNGLAEVVKMGLLAGGKFFEELSFVEVARNRDPEALEMLVSSSVEYKAEVVRQDEKESGLRAVLNYGHTIGHALEAVSLYSLAHGEAIAIGMGYAAELAHRKGMADIRDVQRELLVAAGLPTDPPDLDPQAVLAAMGTDKKRSSRDLRGTHRFVLLEEIGSPVWGVEVSEDEALEVLGGV